MSLCWASAVFFILARAASRQFLARTMASFTLPSKAFAAGNLQYTSADTGVLGWSPWFKKKGVSPVLAFQALFTANSQHGSLTSQSSWMGDTKCLNMSSKVRLDLSVCPSVCGWYAVLKSCSTPSNAQTNEEKAEVKIDPRSETIPLGSPCLLKTSHKNIGKFFTPHVIPNRCKMYHFGECINKYHNCCMTLLCHWEMRNQVNWYTFPPEFRNRQRL